MKPDEVINESEEQTFRRWILGMGAVGLLLAFGSDGSWWGMDTPFLDAAREIGGAVVAGALLA